MGVPYSPSTKQKGNLHSHDSYLFCKLNLLFHVTSNIKNRYFKFSTLPCDLKFMH